MRPTHLTLVSCLTRLRLAPAALLVVLAGACDTDRPDTMTGPETGPDARPIAPAFASTASSGLPFGFWRLEYSQLGSDWTSLQANASTTSLIQNLEIARSRGGRVFIRLAGSSPSRYQNSDGSFSLTKFKALLDQYRNMDLDSYIADGTLAGHMMLDEPSDGSNWNGKPIPFQTLEDAAKYSKTLWPKLPTFVRSVPTWLAGASFRWQYLDGGWAQYSARKGPVDSYRDAEVRAASDEGLLMVWGLNVLDGGDGSSGKHFNSSTKFSMSASELLKYGKSLMAASNSCGFLMWNYQSDYMASSGILDAMKTLSAEAKTHALSCGDGGSVPAPIPPGNVAPVASFTGTCTGLTCAFTSTSQDSDGRITAWKWDFGDGTGSTQAAPLSHAYATGGDYTVVLTVTDDQGASSVASKVVTAADPSAPAGNLAPVATFTATCTGLSCSFKDTSSDPDGIISARSWSFGNGSTSTSSSPDRTYAASGTYSVTLTVTDNDGATATTTQSVAVTSTSTNVAPAAYFGSACTQLTCGFTDRSKDSDGTIVSWSWNFGDGTGSTVRNPSHAFKAGGTYKVKLTVTDNDGATDPITHSVTVAP